MRDDSAVAAMHEHYARGLEEGRLDQGHGRLEFERTKEIIRRHLPDPPAVVADIGGGPGRYALWLAGLGYEVVHRDLVQLHVDQLRQASNGSRRIRSAVGDARSGAGTARDRPAPARHRTVSPAGHRKPRARSCRARCAS